MQPLDTSDARIFIYSTEFKINRSMLIKLSLSDGKVLPYACNIHLST